MSTEKTEATKTNPELATSYAALILADEGLEITPEKLQTLIKAAGITDVEPIWTTLFSKALEGKDVKELMLDVGASGPTDPVGQDPAETDGETDQKDKEEDPNHGDDGAHDSDEDSYIGMTLFD